MITLHGMGLHYSLDKREEFLRKLGETKDNCVLLHTCNRTEAYEGKGYVPEAVVRHLFRVVCGLESALPGETAIQGQVKDAYGKARDNSYLSPQLHKLFQHALRVGKRVRTDTNISKGALSHGKAVIEILNQDRVDLARSKILMIGVNNLNESVVKYFTEKGNSTVFIANRTYSKALALGVKYGAAAVRFDKLSENINRADIVISATSAPHLIVKKNDLVGNKRVIIFDLAVPRDIDAEIGKLSFVTLYNIEDIEKRINVNKYRRAAEIEKAEKIIDEEIRKFYGAGK